MANSTLTRKGQTTIPLEIREALGLRPGMRLVFEIGSGGTAVLRAHPGAMSAFGALKAPGEEVVDFRIARETAQSIWAAEAASEGDGK